jgi:hypothetical protein
MLSVSLLSVLLVASTVLIHLGALRWLARHLASLRTRQKLFAFLLVLALLVVHMFEIMLFAGGYAWIHEVGGTGELIGDLSAGWRDYVYFSGTVYTSVGFGDLLPKGSLRMLAGIEAMTGLLMVAWSGSFTFVQMRHVWETED